MAQIHHGQLQHLQQSLASVHAALEVKSEALSRAEAGRVRLRAALVEQRTEAEAETKELDRQLRQTQRQLQRLSAGGDDERQAAPDELKAQMDETFASGQREAAEAELAAQQAALAVERQLQAQQAKYNEQLQTELAAARRRQRSIDKERGEARLLALAPGGDDVARLQHFARLHHREAAEERRVPTRAAAVAVVRARRAVGEGRQHPPGGDQHQEVVARVA